MRPRVLALFILVALVGCLDAPAEERCGEIQRRSDGAWLLPTARASSSLPAYQVRVESALGAAWEEAYAPGSCSEGVALKVGAPVPEAPWLGPVLHPGERDAVSVVLVERALPGDAPWRIVANASGSVRVEPSEWEGHIDPAASAHGGSARTGFVVYAEREGVGRVTFDVRTSQGERLPPRSLDYVVEAGAGEPHRP